jgi:hypothetical protein
MVRAADTLRTLHLGLLLGLLLACSGSVGAQEGLPVTLVTPDGSHVPFTIAHQEGTGWLISSFAGDVASPSAGVLMMDVGGTIMPVPVDQIARADTISWGGEQVWRYTLDDGRVFVAPRGSGPNYFLSITGLNEFGVRQQLTSRPGGVQPFLAIVFDPNATADTIYLRSGDVMNGEVVPRPMALDTAYGRLVFEPWQLQRIVLEGAANGEDLVLFRSGDQMRGILDRDHVELIVASGTSVVPIDEVHSVTFRMR